jgi:hypothetical protein
MGVRRRRARRAAASTVELAPYGRKIPPYDVTDGCISAKFNTSETELYIISDYAWATYTKLCIKWTGSSLMLVTVQYGYLSNLSSTLITPVSICFWCKLSSQGSIVSAYSSFPLAWAMGSGQLCEQKLVGMCSVIRHSRALTLTAAANLPGIPGSSTISVTG